MSEQDLDREIAEDMARDEMDRLREQNAAMLEALEIIVAKSDLSDTKAWNPDSRMASILETARAALALVQKTDND